MSAMRQTILLAKKEISRTKDNFEVIKELGTEAKQILLGQPNAANDQSFESAMQGRTESEVTDLYLRILWQKRIVLGVGCAFAGIAFYTVVRGLINHNLYGVLLGCMSLTAVTPMTLVLALSAQLRLWQIRTRRLSVAERGGIYDFMRETRWLRETLSPEIGQGRKTP